MSDQQLQQQTEQSDPNLNNQENQENPETPKKLVRINSEADKKVYLDPIMGEKLDVNEILKKVKVDERQKQDLNEMINLLSKQKQQHNKNTLINRNRLVRQVDKETDRRIRGFRSNQFSRHPNIFEARNISKESFQKMVYLPPVGYEKKVWPNIREKKENEKLEKLQLKQSQKIDLSTSNANMSTQEGEQTCVKRTTFNVNNSKMFLYQTSKSPGGYFDELSPFQKYPPQSLNFTDQVNMSQNRGLSQNNSSVQGDKSIQHNSKSKSFNSSQLKSLVKQQNSILQQSQASGMYSQIYNNSMYNSQLGGSQQLWRQHYGVNKHKPMFTDLEAGIADYKKKDFSKKQKNISDQIFLPSNSFQQKRLFQEFPYSIPQKEPEIKLDHNFSIQMGF